jgi:hypothetical protein
MTANAVRGGESAPTTSLTALPIDIPYRTRLSWGLGTRVVEDLDADRLCRWMGDGGWALAVFRATPETIVIRFRTPAGRELFYGAEAAVRSAVRSRLDATASWRRID